LQGVGIDHNKTDGALYLYDYAGEHSLADPVIPLDLIDYPAAKTDFHPVGIEYHAPSNTLFVVNAARAGPSIEIFKLYLSEHFATHTRTLMHPVINTPNAIHALNDHEIYFSNDHYFRILDQWFFAQLETYLAISLGNVVYMNTETMEAKTVARLPFANGIARLDADTLAVAACSAAEVNLYAIDHATHALSLKRTIKVPFMPDNLSVDDAGKLLIAGHGHAFAFTKVVKARATCDTPECRNVSAPSYVAEWVEDESQKNGRLTDLYVDDAYGTSTIAVRDAKRKKGFVSGVYASGILTWHE